MSERSDGLYLPVDGTVLFCTEKAVRFEPDGGEPVWIPRSCILGTDDSQLDDLPHRAEFRLHAFEWVWRKNGVL